MERLGDDADGVRLEELRPLAGTDAGADDDLEDIGAPVASGWLSASSVKVAPPRRELPQTPALKGSHILPRDSIKRERAGFSPCHRLDRLRARRSLTALCAMIVEGGMLRLLGIMAMTAFGMAALHWAIAGFRGRADAAIKAASDYMAATEAALREIRSANPQASQQHAALGEWDAADSAISALPPRQQERAIAVMRRASFPIAQSQAEIVAFLERATGRTDEDAANADAA